MISLAVVSAIAAKALFVLQLQNGIYKVQKISDLANPKLTPVGQALWKKPPTPARLRVDSGTNSKWIIEEWPDRMRFILLRESEKPTVDVYYKGLGALDEALAMPGGDLLISKTRNSWVTLYRISRATGKLSVSRTYGYCVLSPRRPILDAMAMADRVDSARFKGTFVPTYFLYARRESSPDCGDNIFCIAEKQKETGCWWIASNTVKLLVPSATSIINATVFQSYAALLTGSRKGNLLQIWDLKGPTLISEMKAVDFDGS